MLHCTMLQMHEGIVLKHNSNQRYATNSISAALFREVGHRRGIPCQVRSRVGTVYCMMPAGKHCLMVRRVAALQNVRTLLHAI
jgi:hypothetical protein